MENVELPLLYGDLALSKRQRHEKAKTALHHVGLAGREGNYPSQLSGGQQQRVAIARALASRPNILMGDEPTGNLDSRTSREIIDLFRQLNTQHGLTVILVTHDLAVARTVRRNLVLRDGAIVCDTTDPAQAAAALHDVAQLT
jgi:predicted ABC-type transport system involved in lysophospholipase L1 biosynthesis ATPase subunit